MHITLEETEKLLKEDRVFTQVGFSMLLERLKRFYAQDSSQLALQKCTDEINAFIDKFKMIMAADYENITKSLKSQINGHIMTFDETTRLINDGKLLHIAGTENLLRKLPKGNWIGGSTEYFMTKDGGKVSGELLLVTEFPYKDFFIRAYDSAEVANVANDAFDNGFSIVIFPFDSEVHTVYAKNATSYENIFMRNITGWAAGVNLNIPGQTPVAVNGMAAQAHANKAVALHLKTPDAKTARINIINIFTPDEKSPVIEFTEEGFSVKKCYVDGKETEFADYITRSGIDTRLPLIGNYSGNGANVAFKTIENDVVNLYAPVFSGIKYRIAKEVKDYAAAFQSHIAKISGADVVFSCNCILNFLYGELEGKKTESFIGPITFGEIAYQLLSQTLVYVTVADERHTPLVYNKQV